MTNVGVAKQRPCPGQCGNQVQARYWLCPPCWRLLPAEVRQVVRESFRIHAREQTRESAVAAILNCDEAERILYAIRMGVPA